MTVCIMTISIIGSFVILSITTEPIKQTGTMTLSTMTVCIMTISIMGLVAILSITKCRIDCCYANCQFSECVMFFMLNVVAPSTKLLNLIKKLFCYQFFSFFSGLWSSFCDLGRWRLYSRLDSVTSIWNKSAASFCHQGSIF